MRTKKKYPPARIQTQFFLVISHPTAAVLLLILFLQMSVGVYETTLLISKAEHTRGVLSGRIKPAPDTRGRATSGDGSGGWKDRIEVRRKKMRDT